MYKLYTHRDDLTDLRSDVFKGRMEGALGHGILVSYISTGVLSCLRQTGYFSLSFTFKKHLHFIKHHLFPLHFLFTFFQYMICENV